MKPEVSFYERPSILEIKHLSYFKNIDKVNSLHWLGREFKNVLPLLFSRESCQVIETEQHQNIEFFNSEHKSCVCVGFKASLEFIVHKTLLGDVVYEKC